MVEPDFKAVSLIHMSRFIHEQWRPIPGYLGYAVSNYGRVRREKRMVVSKTGQTYTLPLRRLHPHTDRNGYKRISPSIGGRVKTIGVHQAVAWAFLGPQLPSIEVRHLDGKPGNNVLSNLAYGTRAENILDAKRHGTFPLLERRPGAKLTREKVVAIFTSAESVSVLEKRFGIGKGVVRQIKMRETWQSVTTVLPDAHWNGKPGLDAEALRMVLDRSIPRAEVMARLGVSFHQVKYFRKRYAERPPAFRDRFSAEQWRVICDERVRAVEAAAAAGVSLSYVKSVRRRARQQVVGA